MGKSSINGSFSMAMLNNQRVYTHNVAGQYTNPLANFHFVGIVQLPTTHQRDTMHLYMLALATHVKPIKHHVSSISPIGLMVKQTFKL